MKILELHDYIKDTSSLFNLVEGEAWSQYLDSGVSYDSTRSTDSTLANKGIDILVCRPESILLTYGEETEHYGPANYKDCAGRALLSTSSESPFQLLKQLLLDYEFSQADFIDVVSSGESQENENSEQSLPFFGGAVGYFGYELARRIEELPEHAQDDIGLPDMAVGIYEVAVVTCHQRKKSWFIDVTGKNITLKEFWLEKINSLDYGVKSQTDLSNAWQIVGDMQTALNREEYGEKFSKIKQYLNDGDCYQINLTNRFEMAISGNSWQSYLKMRAISIAPFGAYMNFPFAQLLSNSPERFIECFDGNVKTSPIKGTRPRDLQVLEHDLALANELEVSTKDQAENVMIVDLLRNDLGRVCEIGSVEVPKLFAIESYANVHHLVSHVSGKLRADFHALDLLQACFPGGSITGAPKKRAMEIIDELEPYCRGVYCGAIGWIDFRGNMQTNIAIRTITAADGKGYFSAGGGIVMDSEEEDEYQELLNKAAIMMKTVGFDS